MKIEIGEQVMYSWLKHVKLCQVVQTNWKASPFWKHHGNINGEQWLEKCDHQLYQQFKYHNTFKDSNIEQFLNQGELDVLGINYVNDSVKYYGVEVAFHENGLQYGSREDTTKRIIKKMIRASLLLNRYFNTTDAQIIFASPKIGHKQMTDIVDSIEFINKFFKENDTQFRVKLLANEDFSKEILLKLNEASKKVSDTSDLFLRSVQIMEAGARKNHRPQDRW